jgi:dienelactone hydrolase
MDDGTEAELGPGDAHVVPPGHDAWVVGDEQCVLLDIGGGRRDPTAEPCPRILPSAPCHPRPAVIRNGISRHVGYELCLVLTRRVAHHPCMTPPVHRRVAVLALISGAVAVTLAAGPGAAAAVLAAASPTTSATTSVTDYSGALPDGATWKAEIPSNWNGTLLLYSHGYLPTFVPVPNTASDAPDPVTGKALLAEGYGLTGSSYAAAGWALGTAPQDQLDTLSATVRAIGRRPHRVLAVGTSMGGLVTAKLAELAGNRIQGALPTCGIVGGGEALGNYQLDGEYAISKLLAPGQPITLVHFANLGQAFATTGQLVAAVEQAQTTPAGRARVALVAALYQSPSWAPGQPAPPPAGDAAAVELGQYQWLLQTLQFTTPGRFDIETAAGGNPNWNVGVDYARLLGGSTDRATVRALYRSAGLDLDRDLRTLTAAASITADPAAAAWMFRTSVPSGRIGMPVLSLHTTTDQLVPVQHENAYRRAVEEAGRESQLRQAFVQHQGHCNFTPAELVAAVHALDHRVSTGRWDDAATTTSLQRAALALGLGPAAYLPFRPGPLLRATVGDDRRWRG